MKRLFQVFSVIAILALVLAALPMQSAQAATPTELFFSEYIEGSSNNKALEIYNGAGAAIDLAAGGYNIQMYFNGSATASLTINLIGAVANGDVFVIAQASANATILAQADQTQGSGWFNGDDTVVLRKGTTVLDAIGQIGTDPGTEWGSGLASTADNTLNRKNTVCAGDSDSSNVFDPALEWDGSATDTFSGLGVHTANCPDEDPAPEVASTTPAESATDIAINANLALTFSEAVDVSGDWFTLTCTSTGSHTAVATSSNATTFTLDPETDFANSETCTLTVLAAQVTDQDTVDPLDNLAGDFVLTFSTVSAVDSAPEISSITPANAAVDVAIDSNIVITFSEAVSVNSAWFQIACSSSGVRNVADTAVTGGPTVFTINPTFNFANSETCAVSVYAAQVADQDSNDPPDNLAADFSASFTTAVNACTLTYTPIYNIQGSGLTAAITGNVSTMGVVVGDNEGASPTLRGFFLQDLSGDGNPATSDGIFVFNGNNNNVNLGDVVRVSGKAEEYQGQTQISTVTSIANCGTGSVDSTDVTLPFASTDAAEAYEGMLVRLPQTLYVTEHYLLGRFGEVLLSSAGRLKQPTNVVLPGAPALALQAANDLNQIIVDDALQNQNADPIVFGRNGQPLSASNTLRGGDTATGIVGIMTYTWGGNSASPNAYRVRPINALGGYINFEAANLRPTSAPEVGGTTKIVGMNVLNFFNSWSACFPGGTAGDCRGATSQIEFDRQWPKTIAAILAMDADVVGFNEIENDGYGPDSSIAFLVDKLNEATAPGTYAFIDADAGTGQVNALGNDAIRVGMIYKPGQVTPVGQTAVLNTVAFVNGGDSAPRNRPSLLQAFQVNASGARFLVDINHLKSKGSACDTPDALDGQGNCNQVRVNSVNELLSWFAANPTGTGDPDILMLGDYNSYAMEDPITTLQTNGFTNLVKTFVGDDAYSYVFDGQWGYLDQALGTASLTAQVTGVADYHIDSDEPSVLDYNTDFKTANQINTLYAPDEFRISDHDPVLVGLNLRNDPPIADAGGPYTANEGETVTLNATGSDPDKTLVTFAWDLDNDSVFETPGQSATFAAVDGPATFTLNVQVTDETGLATVASTTLTVNNVAPTAAFDTPATLNEGDAFSISLTAPLDPSPADTEAGFTYAFDCGAGYGAPGATNSTSCTALDDPNLTVKGKITDKDGGAIEYTFDITIGNIAPTLSAITAPTSSVLVNKVVKASATFTDPGQLDTHTATWTWGDGRTSSGVVTEFNGAGSVAGSHTYTKAGVYTVNLTLVDKDGASVTSTFKNVVIYNPNGGFITGGGWIQTPNGKDIFALAAKYPKKTSTTPEGNALFYSLANNIKFISTRYEWMVIDLVAKTAQIKGVGLVDGIGNVQFMIWATDNRPDTFRIKIWTVDDTGEHYVYDNDTHTIVGGGSISILK